MVKILSRLPPKSLIRFKCVSKTWHSIIGNPDFFSQNLFNYSILITQENLSHPLLLVKATEKSIAKKEVLSFLSYNTLDYVCQIPLTLKFVASCKGLLCLFKFRTSDVYIWNPATPSVGLKALPPVTRLPYHVRDLYGSCLGFGFDSRSNDFKVVRIRLLEFQTQSMNKRWETYVEICSLSGGSWRLLHLHVPMDFGFLMCPKTLALDGVFIWWFPYHNIIAFDFSDEVFRTTPLPRLSENGDNNGSTITLLNGHVALLAFFGSEMNAKCCLEIWVLFEFGVKESWTRVTTIGLPMDLERPLGFWKRGELFMENSEGQLVLYDPFTKTKKNLQIDSIKRTFQIALHTQSSVAI